MGLYRRTWRNSDGKRITSPPWWMSLHDRRPPALREHAIRRTNELRRRSSPFDLLKSPRADSQVS